MTKELEAYKNYIKEKNIKNSKTREKILQKFLTIEGHLTINELYDAVKKELPNVGLATVYRTMKTLCDAGLAEEIDIGDGMKRFEHKFEHKHHDHLICIKCGRMIEFVDEEIEKLQKRICDRYNFIIKYHKLQIFGYCNECR